jgi:general secretion pathway protein J
MRSPTVHSRGFTLAEVLIASTISVFIAFVAVGALKTVTDSSQVVTLATETSAEVRFAARMIACDLANLYRDLDPRNMRLVGMSPESMQGGPGSLTFYAAGRIKARVDQPEGDVYEVEYFLGKAEDIDGRTDMDRLILFRRLWPNPDKERTPGGVVTPVAEGLDAFHMRFFDGQQWASEWPEEMQSLPQVIEITLVAMPRERAEPVVEILSVSFPRLPQTAAAATAAQGQEPGQQPDQGQGQSQGQDQSQGQSRDQGQGRGQGSQATPNASRSRR